MLKLTPCASSDTLPDDTLTLTHDERQKSRQRAMTDTGIDAGIFLPRRTTLKPGDTLRAEDGRIVVIRARPEPVSVATTVDPWLLARAAYHLGNRHVALEVRPGELRYLQDHVLDEMVLRLGLKLRHEETGFEPEPGAYHGASHAH
jgi:urease accessory protein